MNIGYKCPKYKLDAWGICEYKINCEIDDCEYNCAIEMDKVENNNYVYKCKLK